MITPKIKLGIFDETVYNSYVWFAYDAFKFLVPKITKFNKDLRLEIDYADYVNNTLANFRHPSTIYIHILNIWYACNKANPTLNDVYNMILITLTHEIFHSEQYNIHDRYRTDNEYKGYIEGTVNKAAYDFLKKFKRQIYDELGVELNLNYFEYVKLTDEYKKCDLGMYYELLFRNIIFRNELNFIKFRDDVLIPYHNIYVSFNNGPNFIIKSNGEYCSQTLYAFILAINSYSAKYDYYTMSVNLDSDSNRSPYHTISVSFNMLDRGIYPMEFSN